MDIKLHLGCGKRHLPGYVHIDRRKLDHVDHVCDFTRDRLPYGDDEVDLIYAAHVIEHVERPRLQIVFDEWHRVLKPDIGVLRLSVPDFNVIATLYLDHGVSLIRLWGFILGRQNYPENTHYTVWDYELLAYVLTENGFYGARRWEPSDVLPPEFNDYSYARYNGICASLNLEVTAI